MNQERRVLLAEFVSAVLGPVPMGVLLSLAIGIQSGRGFLAGAGWGLLSIGCAAVLPAAATAPFRRRSTRTTRDRFAYILPAVAGALIGLALLVTLHAPFEIFTLAAALIGGLIGSAVVNLVHTSSNHVAALAGGITIAATLVTPLSWFLTPLVVALAWARVASGAHKRPDVALGAVVGVVTSTSVLWVL